MDMSLLPGNLKDEALISILIASTHPDRDIFSLDATFDRVEFQNTLNKNTSTLKNADSDIAVPKQRDTSHRPLLHAKKLHSPPVF
jgi:hypothetical protein